MNVLVVAVCKFVENLPIV